MSQGQLPIVYADESNNTGENLTDIDQPVFSVAGVHLGDEIAQDLVDSVQAALKTGAGEPKYSKVRKSPKGREALLDVLKSLPANAVKTHVTEKRFMAIAKIIDLGAEQIMYEAGYNMHADRSARTLAHLIAATGPVMGDRVTFEKVLDIFVAVVREVPGVNAMDYVKAAKAYLATLEGEKYPFDMALLPDPAWLHQVMRDRALGHLDKTLDPAIPGVVEMCRGFESVLGSFALVHDHSKVIESTKADLLAHDQIPDPADPTRTNASIGVTEITFGDSKCHAQLQIADWVAGFTKDVAMIQWGFASGEVTPEQLDLTVGWLAGTVLALDIDLLNQMGNTSPG